MAPQLPAAWRALPWLALICLAGLSACKPGSAEYRSVKLERGQLSFGKAAAPKEQPLATFDQSVLLLRAAVEPAEVQPGQPVTFTLELAVLEDLFEDWKIFVHGQLPGAEMTQLQDDHDPLQGYYPTSRWRRGDLIQEQRRLVIPRDMQGRTLNLYIGLYRGEQRMAVSQAANHDGHNRVLAAQVRLAGGQDIPVAIVRPTAFKITIDGKLDEPPWALAQRLGPFVNYHGRGSPTLATHAKLVYGPDALYLGFECADEDIWTSYTKRDDPIYNEEAVEIFIDVDADLHTYVELQNSPANVHFDAAFEGRRAHMDTGYNAEYQTAVRLDGTLNDPSDQDRGWVAEWRIPYNQIRGLSAPPKPGDRWRINLFRLDKVRRGGRVVDNQASAWSSPLSGDFHNIQRFGWLEFSAEETGAKP